MKTQTSGQADGPTGILVENWPIYPRSKLGTQLGPRKQPFGFVWFSYKRTHRRTTAGPMGRPQLQGLGPGKDPVDRTTLRPPMDAGDGQVPVNLVQKRRCQLKPRGYLCCCCAPKSSIHMGVGSLSGGAKDCISQAKRLAERMRGFCLVVVLDGAQ